METVTELVKAIGLGPVWTSVIIVLLTVLIYLLKKYVDLKSEVTKINTTYRSGQRAKIDDKLLQYAEAQIPALWQSYRLLYEGEITESIETDKFVVKIKEADQIIWKPYTDYKFVLDSQVIASVRRIHNILEQYKYSPSRKAIKNFLDFDSQDELHKLVKDAEQTIKAQCIKIGG